MTGRPRATTVPSRAHVGQTPAARPVTTGRHGGHVPPDEREHLAATLGELLRRERTTAGWSVRGLARAVPCSPATVYRLETGRRRPRPCLLRCIASVLAVDEPKPLAAKLIEAAGSSLRPDTDAAIRHRNRRANAAILAGHRPLPTDLARRLAQHRQADALDRQADQLFHRPGALNDVDALDEMCRLHEQARQLRAQAGPPIILRIGSVEIRAGLP